MALWYPQFFARHCLRCPDVGWPAPRTEAFDARFGPWAKALKKLHATEPEADEASMEIAADPPSRAGDHLFKLTALIRSNRDRRRHEALRAKAREAAGIELRAVLREDAARLILRESWAALDRDQRAELWARAGEAGPRCRLRYFRELEAYRLAEFPSPVDLARGMSDVEAEAIKARLEPIYGFDFDPAAGLAGVKARLEGAGTV